MHQDNPSSGINSSKLGGVSKIKLESHLCLNLKRKIKDQQVHIQMKNDEIEGYRRNIKVTKMQELEIEMKMYIDECQRLRTKLEDIIQSKDTFADPQELQIIQEKF